MKNKLCKHIIRCYYSWRDGIKFEKGYEYKLIRHTNLDIMEKHHKLLLECGYERESDVNAGFKYAECWYRRIKKN